MVASDIDIFHPHPGAAATLAAALPGRRCHVHAEPASLLARGGAVEVLLAPGLPHVPKDISLFTNLRLVHALGAGVDGLLGVPERVPIASARGLFAAEVSEHAWALILALERGIPLALEQQRARQWRRYGPRSLAGRTLGVLGLGAVGRRIALLGHAFGLRVHGTRRRPEPVPGVERVVAPADTHLILAGADIVVVAVPLTPATAGLLDRQALGRLRAGATLILVSRGGIVDELALVERLQAGALRGAALDVTALEPLPADSALWTAPNLLLTPHVAGLGTGTSARLVELIRANLARHERGEPPLDLVNRAWGY